MKKFARLLSIITVAAVIVCTLGMSAFAAAPVGQFVFTDKSTVDPTKWAGQAASVLSYNDAEKALQVSRQENSSKANGINNDVEDANFSDIGYQPVPVGGADGYNFMKIKMKATNGFAPEMLLMHLSDAEKGWRKTAAEIGSVAALSDGQWHEFIFDISGAVEAPLNMERMMIYVTGMDENKDQALLYSYVCFFKTKAEAEAYGKPAAPATSTGNKAPVTADLGTVAAVASLISGAAAVSIKKRK